jgi:hypothetical protein
VRKVDSEFIILKEITGGLVEVNLTPIRLYNYE